MTIPREWSRSACWGSVHHPLRCRSAGREAGSTALEQHSVTWFFSYKEEHLTKEGYKSVSKDPVVICGLRLCTPEVRREEMHSNAVESWPKRGRVCSNVKFSLSLCVMLFVVLDNLKNYRLSL